MKTIRILLFLAATCLLVLLAGNAPDALAEGQAAPLKGWIGIHLQPFFTDPEVKELLSRQGIVLEPRFGTTGQIIAGFKKEDDFVLLTNDIDVHALRAKHQLEGGEQVNPFSTSLVLVARTEVLPALIAAGYVEDNGGVAVLKDQKGLVKAALSVDADGNGTEWSKLPNLDDEQRRALTSFGEVMIGSSDPAKSNNGRQFAFWMAATNLGNRQLTTQLLPDAVAIVRTYFERLGYVYPNVDRLFQALVTAADGQMPLAMVYESQVLGFCAKYPNLLQPFNDHVRIIYPAQSVVNGHPLLQLKPTAAGFGTALGTTELQKIALTRFGLRPFTIGASLDFSAFGISGVPKKIPGALKLPNAAVYQEFIEQVSKTGK